MAERYPYNPNDDPIGDRAAFAQRFSGTTNLDQRRRFAQDISEAATRDQERRDAEFQAAQEKNPKLMDAVTKRIAEERLGRESVSKKSLAERKFQWDQEKASRVNDLNLQKFDLDQQREKRLLDKEARDLQDAKRMDEDTDALELGEYNLRQKGLVPGMKAYEDGLLNILSRTPYAKPDARKVYVENLGVTRDPNELQKELIEMREKFPNSTLSVLKDGQITVREVPPKTATEEKPNLARLDKLTKEEADLAEKEGKDELSQSGKQRLGYLRNEIKAIDATRKPIPGTQPTASTQAPATAAVQPSAQPAGGTIWRADKSGNLWEYDANKKPTGNFKPAK